MANTTTIYLFLLPTLLLIIFYCSSNFFHQNNFNTSLSSSKLLTPPSTPPINTTINQTHIHVHHNITFPTKLLEKKQKKKDEEKNSLEKIEEGLARARAAIREAARTWNYTSEEEQAFIPRGPVYKNPYAFHQSHIEMVKRFKIWSYREGEPPMVHQGPTRNIYGVEGQFIEEIEGEMSSTKFMARHPDEAHLFFLPFSVSKMAPDIPKADPKLLHNLIRALCNANSSEGFRPIKDVSIPEVKIPVGSLNPRSINTRISKRQIFAFFAGGMHGNVRKYLFEIWKEKDEDIKVYDYLPKHLNYFQMLGQSKFCLCPSGYEVASPRIVEAIHGDCVPVIIKDNYSFPFSDVLDWSKFSVHISVDKIPEIKRILKGISSKKYLKLLKGVRSVKRHFTINKPSKPFDLMHMMLHSLWLRRLNIRVPY